MDERILEGVLFAAAKPLSYELLSEIFGISIAEVKSAVDRLSKVLKDNNAGIEVRKIQDTVELVTAPKCGVYIEKIRRREENLSSAALEALAIIAFKQPITKTEIEEIRGVNCEKVLKQLQAKDFITDLGRKNVIGRPILYGTTEHFLRCVGAQSLEELENNNCISEILTKEK